MYTVQLPIAAAAFASLALANPLSDLYHTNARRQNALTTSQVEWENPTGGNLQLGYANQGLQFGTSKPSDIIRNSVAGVCSTVGTCVGGNDVSLDSAAYIDDGFMDTLDIKYTVNGDYPQWVHNGLIDMLAWAIGNQTQTNNVCYSPYATSSCNFMAYCPEPQQSCQDQYTAPGAVAVVLAGDMVDADAAPGYISMQFDIEKEGDGDLCSKLTSLGAGLAGFTGEAGGPAGGLFTLASLFCQS